MSVLRPDAREQRTLQVGATVVAVALLVRREAVLAAIGGAEGSRGNGLDDAAVEALDHAVGLGRVGARQAVLDGVGSAEAIEGVAPAGSACACWHIAAETVGEFRAPRHRARTDGATMARSVSTV